MNANSGNDPMLSSFINEDWSKFQVNSAADSAASSLVTSQSLSTSFLISPDGLLNLEQHAEFSDLTTLWPTERKRVLSVKMEDDDDSFSSYSVAGDADNRDIDMQDIDMVSQTTGTNIKGDGHDNELYDIKEVNSHDCQEYKFDTNKFQMSEAAARKYVEEQFEKIAVVPKSHLNQREKIQFILARSDCTDFAVEDIVNFDKKCPDSARACAQIVQNIPQRYRWECVKPEDIPCCYTIVADCKKVSCRDKPPRPMNAFMIWAQSARRLINELCPKMQNALISEALGYYWRQKNDAFKQRFEQEKMKLRTFHSVEFPEYKYKPKTKVQKAREKQELSLTKAKMRASVKLEKLRRTEEACPRRTNSRCGRPKKAKVDPVKKETNPTSSSQYVLSEKCMRKSPTKPAIKDMLTLKILSDRMCKDTNNRRSRSNELVVSAFGQMSPLEVDSRGSHEAMEDLSNFDQDLRGKAASSSVFDTPANTPPVDDDERHHSPLNPQQVSPSAAPAETTHQTAAIVTNINPPSFTSSPLAMAISPAKSGGIPKDTQSLSLLDLLTKRTSLTTVQPQPVETNQVLDITDLLFTYVTESLSAAQQSTYSPAPHYPKCNIETIDANNNNSSDINYNYQGDINNNNISNLGTSAPKIPNFLYEANDLDTLFLDLNVPVLTDDDVRSILNTL